MRPYETMRLRYKEDIWQYHKRYRHNLKVTVYFYGNAEDEEMKKCAERSAKELAKYLGAKMGSINFLRNALAAGGIL